MKRVILAGTIVLAALLAGPAVTVASAQLTPTVQCYTQDAKHRDRHCLLRLRQRVFPNRHRRGPRQLRHAGVRRPERRAGAARTPWRAGLSQHARGTVGLRHAVRARDVGRGWQLAARGIHAQPRARRVCTGNEPSCRVGQALSVLDASVAACPSGSLYAHSEADVPNAPPDNAASCDDSLTRGRRRHPGSQQGPRLLCRARRVQPRWPSQRVRPAHDRLLPLPARRSAPAIGRRSPGASAGPRSPDCPAALRSGIPGRARTASRANRSA